MKHEPTYQIDHETLIAAGYIHRSSVDRGGFYGPQHGGRSSGRGRGNFRGRSRSNGQRNQDKRKINPVGANGAVMTCVACGSYRHLLADCPDSWENMSKTNVTEILTNPVLFTGNNIADVKQLAYEAQNCAVLDCACSSTVCGQK